MRREICSKLYFHQSFIKNKVSLAAYNFTDKSMKWKNYSSSYRVITHNFLLNLPQFLVRPAEIHKSSQDSANWGRLGTHAIVRFWIHYRNPQNWMHKKRKWSNHSLEGLARRQISHCWRALIYIMKQVKNTISEIAHVWQNGLWKRKQRIITK